MCLDVEVGIGILGRPDLVIPLLEPDQEVIVILDVLQYSYRIIRDLDALNK